MSTSTPVPASDSAPAASSPAAPAPTTASPSEGASPASAPTAPAPTTALASEGAPPASAPAAPAAATTGCPAGSHAPADAARPLPGFSLLEADRICDVGDRVIVVDARSVTVVTRPRGNRTRAPISRREGLADRCSGPGGGHAGCSITFQRFWSVVLGHDYVEFGSSAGNFLAPGGDFNRARGCREPGSGPIAVCATATRFVAITDEERADRPSCQRLRASLWDGAADERRELDGDIDAAASTANRWVVRFPGAAGDSAIALAFDRTARAATLEVDGRREPCLAFRLLP